jgi:hypothetical protein
MRQDHDAREIVFLWAMLLFGEIAEKMTTIGIVLRQDVEEKQFDVVIECFVIEQ